MSNRRFDHVHFEGEWEPAFHDSSRSLEQICDDYAVRAKKVGATALQLNFITTPYPPLHYLFNKEVYLFFGNYGANLDLFAETEYNRAIYPRFMLEENINRLRILGQAAERHGLTGLLYLCEPRMQHPEIFERHPDWRGPRVDNPVHSQTKLFALDTDNPAVQDHYRKLLRQLLQAAPGIVDIAMFSGDSGSGWSHSRCLYAGKNGPDYNIDKKFSDRVMDFCEVLRDEGRTVQESFEVTLTSSYYPDEWFDLVKDARDGIHCAVYGPQSWTGGLEDQWAWNQSLGAKGLAKTGYDDARKERYADHQERVDAVRAANRTPRMISPAPNEHYFQLNNVPNPWEPLEILEQYEKWGCRHLFLRGHLTGDDVPYNVNQASCARFLTSPGLSAAEAVRKTVSEWVIPHALDEVLAGLRHVAISVRQRPNVCFVFMRLLEAFPGPLVPDPSLLSAEEEQYYHHFGMDALSKIKKPLWWMPSLDKFECEWVLDQLESVVFSSIDQALKHFKKARDSASSDADSLSCIAAQEKYVNLYRLREASLGNMVRMSAHWNGIESDRLSAPEEIVASEIVNTQDWVKLLGDHPETSFRLLPFKGGMYTASLGITADLRQRITVMQNHASDPPYLISSDKRHAS